VVGLAAKDSGLKVLTSLNLFRTKVTAAAVAAIREARPHLTILSG
jgi:hypothetical protein